jgi:hypothetical protein
MFSSLPNNYFRKAPENLPYPKISGVWVWCTQAWLDRLNIITFSQKIY